MRFHQPIDHILDGSAKVRVLRFLCRKGGEWNGRRLAAELRINPVTTHAALRELHEATLLDFKKVGNSFLYSLRDEHYLVREVLRPLFHRESAAVDRLLELLRISLEKRLWSEIVTIAVYGSIARRQERSDSDIDLLVLVKSRKSQQKIREAFGRLGETAEKEFGNPLALYVNTMREARQKYRRHLPLFHNMLASHRLVWGVSLQEALGGRPA